MRLADAAILPMDFVPCADLILDALAALAKPAGPGAGAAVDVTAAQAKARAFREASVQLQCGGSQLGAFTLPSRMPRSIASVSANSSALGNLSSAVWSLPIACSGCPRIR